jgi:hypothetical protein
MVLVSGWSWCHGCGHRVAGREDPVATQTPMPSGARPRTLTGESELALAARLIPSWVWVLFGGLVVIAAVTCAADMLLPYPSRERAIWSTAQFFLGLAAFLIAGIAVSGHLGMQREHFGLADLFMPDRLWPRALKRLPHTRWHVCAAVWSLSVSLCGVIWVGGWTWWLPTKTPPRPGKGSVVRPYSAPKPEEDPDDPAESKDAKPVTTGEEKKPEEEAPKRATARCVIVGYTLKDGEPAGLVVAVARDDQLHYAGVVPVGDDPAVREDLKTRFAALKADAPVFPDLDVRAVWLRPKLNCDVEATPSDEPQLKDPKFKGLILSDTPQPVKLGGAGDAPADTPGPKPAKEPDKGKAPDRPKDDAGKAKDAAGAKAGGKAGANPKAGPSATTRPPSP